MPVLDSDLLRRALRRPLPGPAAQDIMSPRPPALGVAPPERYREAGVLVLFYPRAGELTLALTRRSDHLSAHAGQISFPGGLREPEDASLAATALREAREELRVPPLTVDLLGPLTPLEIPSSGYRIYPYVAYTPGRPFLRPDLYEVAALIETPLALLLQPAAVQLEVRMIRGLTVQVPYYRVGEHKVWGATAMVLSELIAAVRGAMRGNS